VRVNALLPGTIMTPFELGRAEDVAYAALYLASDESRFVLGTGLVVDGGLSGTRG
jgi:NAD(P)-dependent dehydrogenase (short-subunit alcohol dehydrogenase family)